MPKRKRFRKAYEPPAIPAYVFVTKAKGMTRSLGKLDFEKQLYIQIQNQATTTRILRSQGHFASAGVDQDTADLIQAGLKKWQLRKLECHDSNDAWETLPADFNDLLRRIFSGIWNRVLHENQEDRIQHFIEIVADTLRDCYSSLLNTLLNALSFKQTLVDWNDKLLMKIVEKNTLIDYWFMYKLCMISKPPEFDESSNWGLKPLRNSLFSPYFKEWFSRITAPAIFEKSPQTNLIIKTLSLKKKWTVKDLKELRSCILKTVLENNLVIAKDQALVMDKFLHDDHIDKVLEEEILDDINRSMVKSWDQIKKDKLGGGKRGRKKSMLKQPTNSNASASALVSQLEGKVGHDEFPLALRSCQNSAQVRKWLDKENKRISQMKYDQLFNEKFTADLVNWDVVSAKLMTRTKKLREAADCKICFQHAANPMYETKRNWNEEEKNILKEHAANSEEWQTISSLLPKPRPEFVVFYKWRKFCKGPVKMIWKKEQEETLRDVVKDVTWDKLPVEVNDFLATKKQVQEAFKKVLNPILRFGKFTRVEDCLMMLTLEKLKGQFGREKHFGIMTAYLPWRYESAWRDRAENLFAEYIVPWTMEEDRTLLTLAVSMSRDWSQIAKKFNSFKTRKGCLTRFKILEKRLRVGITLEEYHNSYAMIRYNVREYRHLQDIAALLKEIVKEEVISFEGFSVRDRPPREDELQNLILSFDRDIMASTIRVIETYMTKRDIFWTEWRKNNKVEVGQKKKTHDRRTFHPESTQSIASALHIRDIKLIPKEKLTFKLSQREEEIYKYYAQFCSTKALKKDKPRPYIPLTEKLLELQDVSRIAVKASGVKLQRPPEKNKIKSVNSGVKLQRTAGKKETKSVKSGVMLQRPSGKKETKSVKSGLMLQRSSEKKKTKSIKSGVKLQRTSGKKKTKSVKKSGVKLQRPSRKKKTKYFLRSSK